MIDCRTSNSLFDMNFEIEMVDNLMDSPKLGPYLHIPKKNVTINSNEVRALDFKARYLG